ncbi:EAL domain-containing protein [Sphingomonas sp. JC676]|uniref:putative bifunctional diguanylate cyclase/phosphodiesterase n=1 Tax=Sphingomonas sp. JC676 TaxID=2768065 RepID=UPI00165782D8|nr:EAL domain-containing protein [Sphingomonas sp. JC676]MBC9030816.1 EAL domain-containing protein [Sphingomonas sp. JC676]
MTDRGTKIIDALQRRWRSAALVVSAIAGTVAGSVGVGAGLERSLAEAEWSVRRHAASGTIHIVEIDARSIAAIDRWPWPRSNYARLIDQLRSAGVASIVFDVDFSSQSTPDQDGAFAAGLERADGKVILPTFGQEAGGGQQGWTDSLPIPELRDHSSLAAVSILPDTDGTVRRAPVGTMTGGLPRPSLSAMIAGLNGAAGQDFPIDFAIDPQTIPRHSFVDIRDGKFNQSELAGKTIVIGATAVEMGDRYGVPRHGVISGVVIQALAAETLLAGMPHEGGWPVPVCVALGLAWLILRQRSRLGLVLAIVTAPLMLFVVSTLCASAFRLSFPIVPAMVVILYAGVVSVGMRLVAAAHRRRSHDIETGLPNRVALRDALHSYEGAGVIAARIADFDKLAAVLGDAGTAALVRRVTERIALVAEGSTIYRIEDRMLAWRCYDREQLEERMAALRAAMLSPLEVNGRRVDVALAMGFADEGERASHVLANAALAADRALAAGESWRFHHAEEDEAVDRELSLLSELDEAIGNNEIQVVYQPKLDLKANRISSVEALVRWQHPTRGFLRPDLFIPLAERNDRIAGLTLHVLAQTIADLKQWQSCGHAVTGAVNLSAKLLSAPDFIAEVRRLVQSSDIAPSFLTFEVTESAAMIDPAGAVAALESFQALGISISMDDYGTGQSTLSYLKKLPLNELKIDRSFVQFAHQNRGDGVLVRSTVNLAHELGLKVVAEGIEDAECLAFLRAIGCDLAQGYFISRPVPAEELRLLLDRTYADAA